MADTFAVAIVQGHQNLLEDIGSLLLIEKLSCNDPVEKLSSSTKFCDQVDVLVVFKVLVELNNVGVIKRLEDLDLSKEPVPVLDLGPGNGLDGPLLASLSMCTCAHLSIRTFTKSLRVTFVYIINWLCIHLD